VVKRIWVSRLAPAALICSAVWLGSIRPAVRSYHRPHRHSGMSRAALTLEPIDRADTDAQTTRDVPLRMKAMASVWTPANPTDAVAEPVLDYVPAPVRRLKLPPANSDSVPPH